MHDYESIIHHHSCIIENHRGPATHARHQLILINYRLYLLHGTCCLCMGSDSRFKLPTCGPWLRHCAYAHARRLLNVPQPDETQNDPHVGNVSKRCKACSRFDIKDHDLTVHQHLRGSQFHSTWLQLCGFLRKYIRVTMHGQARTFKNQIGYHVSI